MKSEPAVTLLVLLLVALGCGRPAEQPGEVPHDLRRAETLPRPITMAALHSAGGVPPGWHFNLPPGDPAAGRQTYGYLGCNSCHPVQGEFDEEAGDQQDADQNVSLDLTGMGNHHSAEYFAEAIVNPDAVLIDGPGYLGSDGRSTMPVYPEMSLEQLTNLVAYLGSLKSPGGNHGHGMPGPGVGPPAAALSTMALPDPPASRAFLFMIMNYRIKKGALREFENWFATEGAGAFSAVDGIVSVDSYVDRSRGADAMITVFAFSDPGAFFKFANDHASQALGKKFDSFIGPHGHLVFSSQPFYRVEALSTSAGSHKSGTSISSSHLSSPSGVALVSPNK